MFRIDDRYGRSRQMDKDELEQVWTLYQRGRHSVLRDRLVEHYRSLVFEQAERVARALGGRIGVLDFVAPGMDGLVRAVEGYDPATRVPFAVLARGRIREAVLDARPESALRLTLFAEDAVGGEGEGAPDAVRAAERRRWAAPARTRTALSV